VGLKISSAAPTLELERELLSTGVKYIAGVDEVGRGALAGPVSVGVAIVSAETSPLRLAWVRAHQQLSIKPDHVILDGKHNWLLEPESDLFTPPISDIVVPVTMKIKADASCASVSAASVLAKVARDELMREAALIYPDFGWEGNVGYGSSDHMAAIARLGPTDLHRKSWKLPSGPSESEPVTA